MNTLASMAENRLSSIHHRPGMVLMAGVKKVCDEKSDRLTLNLSSEHVKESRRENNVIKLSFLCSS
jgi:hypothetical protein